MSDGDIVHSRLRRLYQKPYRQLCQGKASSDKCAWVVLESLKKDLMQKSDLPIRLCQSISSIVDQAGNTGDEFSPQNYAALSMNIDNLSHRFDGRPDLKKLALNAGKSILHDLRYGEKFNSENTLKELFRRYMSEVYESEFKERIPLTSQHYAGIDATTLHQRIEEIQHCIDKAIEGWASAMVLYGSISKLRMPPRQRLDDKLDLQEDSMAKYNHQNQEKIDTLLNHKKIGALQITTHELKKYLSSPCEVDWNEL